MSAFCILGHCRAKMYIKITVYSAALCCRSSLKSPLPLSNLVSCVFPKCSIWSCISKFPPFPWRPAAYNSLLSSSLLAPPARKLPLSPALCTFLPLPSLILLRGLAEVHPILSFLLQKRGFSYAYTEWLVPLGVQLMLKIVFWLYFGDISPFISRSRLPEKPDGDTCGLFFL